jgi:hypothetical protein
MNTWDDFIDKLKEGKKAGKTKGVTMSCITNLLYAGAFDELLADRLSEKKDRFVIYNELFEEAKTALGSKALKPKKKKTENVGLSDVNSDLHLALWRQQINPLSTYDLIDAYLPQLKLRGYSKDPSPGRIAYRKKHDNGMIDFLMPDWNYVFKYINTPIWTMFTDRSGMGRLQYLGIVSEASTLNYQNGQKEMLKFKLYIGKEFTDEIVIWPDKETGRVKEYLKESIKPGLIAIFTVKPTYYRNKFGAAYINFDSIGSRGYA